MDKCPGKFFTRRGFLKTSALTAAALSMGGVTGVFLPLSSAAKGEEGQLGFLHNQDTCIGCNQCVTACQKINSLPKEIKWRRLIGKKGETRPYLLSISCNHCADCACIKVCPTNAYEKRAKDGVVIHHPEKCVGCKYCLFACPYHAPQFEEKTGTVGKCNFCYQRLDAGKDPACVKACPEAALQYGLVAKLTKTERATFQPDGLPDPNTTKSSLVVVPPKKK